MPEHSEYNSRSRKAKVTAARQRDNCDAELIAAIREGIVSAERGELKPAEQILAEMKRKYGIQGEPVN